MEQRRRTGDVARALVGGGILLLLALAACSSATGPSDTGGDGTPVKLDIGGNNPNIVVAFGDSISDGYYSANGLGYRDDLQALFAADGRKGIRVLDEADSGTFSAAGVERIGAVLRRDRPAVLVLLYGTNDEHAGLPMSATRIATTSENLRAIIATARGNRTIVVLSTLPPVCSQSRAYQETNIVLMNEKIRAIGEELQPNDAGVILADAWKTFTTQSPPDGCGLINPDHGNHPNEAGYTALARTYYDALAGLRW
ncbi:MAG TPA: SGNH/GDSL hydrolase family protein [bacterium]